MGRRLYDPTDARRLLNPGPVSIVTASWRGDSNAAPVAWTAPVSMSPPMVGVVLHPVRHTADMIRFSEEFALNIPGPELLRETAYFGTRSGADENKVEGSKLDAFTALRVDAPLLDGCLAWIECGLRDVIPTGDHILFVGEVVAVQALEEAYAERWLLEERNFSPLTFLGGSWYAQVREAREAEFEVDSQGGLEAESAEQREEREELEAQEAELREQEGDEGYEEMVSEE